MGIEQEQQLYQFSLFTTKFTTILPFMYTRLHKEISKKNIFVLHF